MKTTKKPLSQRGSKLVEVALRDLEDLSLWTGANAPLTWANLAKRLEVSRQAIERKPEITAAYHAAKANLAKFGEDHAKPENVVRRSFDERIRAMNAEQTLLRRQLDGWLEKWMTIEYNARTSGVNMDRLLAPVPKPDRA